MKKFLRLLFVFALVATLSPSVRSQGTGQAVPEQETMQAVPAPTFTVARFVVAGSIENLEPVGSVNAFAAATEKVYGFLEARDIAEDTTVSFVWIYGGTETATVELPLRKGQRWRTYSSKNIGSRTGTWRVELKDAAGAVVQAIDFTVE